LDPKHRDRLAYVRIVSGKFEKGMKVVHSRSKKALTLAQAQTLFASDRENVVTAYPGDVIGINNPAGNQRKEQRKGLRQNIRLFFVLKDLDHTTLFARARFYPAPVSSARRVRRFARHR
jgi:hypothetical protein